MILHQPFFQRNSALRQTGRLADRSAAPKDRLISGRGQIIFISGVHHVRGFGFVEMTHASEADKAIAARSGTGLGGRTLTINEAKPKSEHSRSGGHRFGGEAGRGRDDYRGRPRQPREPRW